MPPKKEQPVELTEEMIEELQELMDDLNTNLEECMTKDAAAKRARKQTTELSAKFKEFRAASVEHHNKLKEERKAKKEAEEGKSSKKSSKKADEKKTSKKADEKKKSTKKKSK
jgi:hypothetical protein